MLDAVFGRPGGGRATAPGPTRGDLPGDLQAELEARSGIALDGVAVHYNSERPARMGADAYTQGSEIHLGPGSEQHLRHEAWHAVQQRQGRVGATENTGVPVNADAVLEQEADDVAANIAAHPRARAPGGARDRPTRVEAPAAHAPVQGKFWERRAPVSRSLLGRLLGNDVSYVWHDEAPSSEFVSRQERYATDEHEGPVYEARALMLRRALGQRSSESVIHTDPPGEDSYKELSCFNWALSAFNEDGVDPRRMQALVKGMTAESVDPTAVGQDWIEANPGRSSGCRRRRSNSASARTVGQNSPRTRASCGY